MIDNLCLAFSTLGRGNWDKTPSNRDFALDHALYSLNNRKYVFFRSEVNWNDSVVKVAADRRQLTGESPL